MRQGLTALPDAANAPDENGMTALQYCANSRLGRTDAALELRLAEVAGLLLDHGADAQAAGDSTAQALSVAAGHSGNLPIVELLLARAPNPPYPGPLTEALRTMRRQGDRYSRICDALVESGPYDLDGMLLGQARHEDVQATTWLLAHGAEVDLLVKC